MGKRLCLMCKQSLTGKRRDAKFCSARCRQAAFKFRKKMDARPKPRKVAKLPEAKSYPPRKFYCQSCFAEVFYSGPRRNRKFCDPVCRQRAYRARHKRAALGLARTWTEAAAAD